MHARTSIPAPRHGAPDLVLVHGLVISSLYMVPTAARLAPLYSVYAPDLPGFGLSQHPGRALTVDELGDALGAWMDAVGLRRAVLVGNSLGCQISVALAVQRPALVQALILAGPTMDRHARSPHRQIARWLADWPMERPSLATAHARDYHRAGLGRAWATFRHALRDPVEKKLPAVNVPALVTRGSRDLIVPRSWAREVTRLLPRGEYLEIPGGPHVVNYTTPDEFAGMVDGFVQGLDLCSG